MSTSSEVVSVDRPGPDYTLPIARPGEQQFACIMRNRSGFDAGEIDFGLRDLAYLSPGEQRDITETAYALYRIVCKQTGLKSKWDS